MNIDQSTQSPGAGAAETGTVRQTDEERNASRELSLRTLETPGSIPGYEIIRRIGTGSFGAVWLAREVKTGKQVAIKFYNHRSGLDWSLLTREVEKLAVLYTSRDIVGLLDVGWDHDPPYFVMEFLEHGSLQGRLQDGRLPVETAVQLATSIARALVHAHGSGILHCDLKPANVLLDGSDEPRLGDFGQSRLTTEQSPALGTMYYMAPEQADLNAVPDARWDVYALGALLYEMLTGEPPYRTEESERKLRSVSALEDRLAAYRQMIAASPKPKAHRDVKGVDKRLAAIVDGCLKPDPQLRLANVQAVLDKLERRNTARSRRPLIAVGFLGPILFMLAMGWIARETFESAEEAAQSSLIDQALAGDSVSALILADSIERDVDVRQGKVQEFAKLAATREIARVLNEHSELLPTNSPGGAGQSEEDVQELATRRQQFLLDMIEGRSEAGPAPAYAQLSAAIEAYENHLESDERTRDTAWFIVGAQGRQVFRLPARKASGEPQDTIGGTYHWRTYYTGLDRNLPKNTKLDEAAPRTTPGISPHFRSEATDQYMIAIAAPIWSASEEDFDNESGEPSEPPKVIGVIGVLIHISELLKQWEHMIRDTDQASSEHDRFLALAVFNEEDGRASLLDHPWMTIEHLKEVAPSTDKDTKNKQLDDFMSRIQIPDTADGDLAKLVQGQRKHHLDRLYDDPFGEPAPLEFSGKWLAAFARVGDSDWIAIVQERRDTATEPVQDVNRVFARAAVVAIIVFGVLLAILWYFLNRASSSR